MSWALRGVSEKFSGDFRGGSEDFGVFYEGIKTVLGRGCMQTSKTFGVFRLKPLETPWNFLNSRNSLQTPWKPAGTLLKASRTFRKTFETLCIRPKTIWKLLTKRLTPSETSKIPLKDSRPLSSKRLWIPSKRYWVPSLTSMELVVTSQKPLNLTQRSNWDKARFSTQWKARA